MGKANRIRSNRAAATVDAPVVKQKKTMPNWLVSLIAIVITVAIIAGAAATIISENGTFLRMRKTMETENFKVDGATYTYFFNSNFQAFYSSYSTYISYGYFSLNPHTPLKDQIFGTGTYDTALLGSFSGTWHDYFTSQTEANLKEILVYCEEAKARNIHELNDTEKAAIDAEIEAMRASATANNYSLNAFLAMTYGEGVKEKDVRNALELQAIANKCANAITEEFDGKLPLTSEEIVNKYNENKLDFNHINYNFYTFDVDYDDIVTEVAGKDASDAEIAEKKDLIIELYTNRVNEAKEKADKLAACKTQDEFELFIIETYIDSIYEENYKSIKLEDADKPDEETQTDIKSKIKGQLIDLFRKGTEFEKKKIEGESETVEYEGHTVTKKYAEAMEEFKEDIYDLTDSMTDKYFVEDASYIKDSEFFEWAFETNNETRKVGDIKSITTGVDASDASDASAIKDGAAYTNTVYMLTSTQAPDKSLTRNFVFATFLTTEEAQTFINSLKAKGETLTAEQFNEVAATVSTAANDILENYAEGSMGVGSFDTWAYGDDLKVGSYNTTPIKLGESAHVVMLYTGDGEETWKVTVKDAILDEKIQANYETMLTKYAPVSYPKAMAKTKGVNG